MLDFLTISHNVTRSGIVEVSPGFRIDANASDLMTRGHDFYAVWDEENQLWTTDQFRVIFLMDKDLREYADRLPEHLKDPSKLYIKYFKNVNSGSIDKWNKFVKKQMWDNYHELDKTITFADTVVTKDSYVSRRLPYSLAEGSIDCYDRLISSLYDPEERQKLEWAIGSIISGDSKKIQKFMVLYGEAGSGKGTFLNIVKTLFGGYCASFSSKSLGSSNNTFAMESFKDNPLVAIDADGDLSRIEDNTKLNTIVSHEYMEMNEKFKSSYPIKLDSFLFIGSNRPVKITEAKSGLIRRLIDVSPSGNHIPSKEYRSLIQGVNFELGAIAYHCLKVYEELGQDFYNDYIPKAMIRATNDFYDFVEVHYQEFKSGDYVQLKDVWDLYRKYCEYAQVPYPMSMRLVRTELRNYFREYKEDYYSDGKHLRNVYTGFRTEKFFYDRVESKEKQDDSMTWLYLQNQASLLDTVCKSCYAQYANLQEIPMNKWDDVSTKLEDLDTSKLHYVLLPIHHIVIDFDLKDAKGNKSLSLNLEAANKWPKTYAEVSKGGEGLHLHYFYSGDPEELSRVYEEGIEVKVFNGNSSLRRRLTKCNDIPIATINSGLPLKGGKNVVNFDGVKNEKAIRTLIKNNLEKKYAADTTSSVDYIFKTLEEAYESGIEYDVRDLRPKVLAFASNSTNQAPGCIKKVNKMHFCSEKINESEDTVDSKDDIVFFDVEVFLNLFVIVWKKSDGNPVKMINPGPTDVERLTDFRLIGFNNRRYDNHILYARILGYNNQELYDLSRKIIEGSRNAMFGGAYNLSYTDIYDFASAGNKKSLKKWEIELGINHQELGFKWDEPVPEESWELVAEYCINDVLATEAVFNHLKADWTARQILADLAGMSVNSTTNSLTQKIIFGGNKNPQDQFCYRNLAEPVKELDPEVHDFLAEACPGMMRDIGPSEESILPYFDGYTYDSGKSVYKGIEVGEGGYVYSEPGMYGNVALLDIASMHPHSVIAECLFGPKYTKVFRDIVEGRVNIKHEDWDAVSEMLDGKLVPYIQKVKDGEMRSKDLANALKTAINSVYGLTAAAFENPFRDDRNIDNIVAKRGALFMVDLQKEVQLRGYTVAHIKTDSIKIPDATPEIIEFVKEFGKKYGYTFEHEDTYDKMCLVNDAVYIARHKDGSWTATGAQFAQPYVFKTLFSKEPIEFSDMCETKSVNTSIYLDMDESLPENQHDYIFVGRVGSFCPIKEGCGGGVLLREKSAKQLANADLTNDISDKYASVGGTKGYRWLEAETVKNLGKEKDIDKSYYTALVDEAVKDISKYGDFEWFTSDDPYDGRFDVPF